MEQNNLAIVYSKSKDVAVHIAKKLGFEMEDTVKYSDMVDVFAKQANRHTFGFLHIASNWFIQYNNITPRKTLLWVDITDKEEEYFISPMDHPEILERFCGVKDIGRNPFSAMYSTVAANHSIPASASFTVNTIVAVYGGRAHVLRANRNLNQEELHQKLNEDLPTYD